MPPVDLACKCHLPVCVWLVLQAVHGLKSGPINLPICCRENIFLLQLLLHQQVPRGSNSIWTAWSNSSQEGVRSLWPGHPCGAWLAPSIWYTMAALAHTNGSSGTHQRACVALRQHQQRVWQVCTAQQAGFLLSLSLSKVSFAVTRSYLGRQRSCMTWTGRYGTAAGTVAARAATRGTCSTAPIGTARVMVQLA